ncbi:MXAN_6640 family putative metalloprotease [Nocardioides sp.]|uniref:MXAN_6640 family putative metalloprotease n=1 Tax=Nocardioides sp. TaxID=35761 RepID=UPI0039E408C9
MSVRRLALFLLAVGLVLAALSPATAQAAKPDPKKPLLSTVDLPPARAGEAAELTTVRDLFSVKTPAEARAALRSGSGRDATTALRDLSVAIDQGVVAAGSGLYDAFQRPWDYTPAPSSHPGFHFHRACSGNVCVHWINPTDAATWQSWFPSQNIDSWVSTDAYAADALSVLTQVSQTYQASGYRLPKGEFGQAFASDPDQYGGSNQTDIYLMELGSQGLYGYCTVDRDQTGQYLFPPSGRQIDMPGFCVIDNDFTGFPLTPAENLRVTAAHEYHHAVQFAYDYLEDRWFMEATSVFMETQLFPDIDDNLQYLANSPLTHPGRPLDLSRSPLFYGTWSFLQFLDERLSAKTGALPTFLLQAWQNADTVAGPDMYSIKALAAAVKASGGNFNRLFAAYADANRHPWASYAEGAVNQWPTTKARKTIKLKPSRKRASGSLKVKHLAAGTLRFTPVKLNRKKAKLSISVDLAKKKTGSAAVVTTYLTSGALQTKFVKLKKNGNGKLKVPFSSESVAFVELTLVNASHSYTKCYKGKTEFSCNGGQPTKAVTERYSVRVR